MIFDKISRTKILCLLICVVSLAYAQTNTCTPYQDNINAMQNVPQTSPLAQRVRATLFGVLIGDSLAMPVHWFYNPNDIKTYFPPNGIQKYEDAPQKHPSSLMNLMSVKRGGRKAYEGAAGNNDEQIVVGNVILKGKEKNWGKANVHYHHGMKAGDNTLNAMCARLVLRTVGKLRRYDSDAFLDEYVAFMTSDTPQHNDSYAESFHRSFFHNYAYEKRAPKDCAESTHDADQVGALVMLAPAVVSEYVLTRSREKAIAAGERQLLLHHKSQRIGDIARAYSNLLVSLLERPNAGDGSDVTTARAAIAQAGAQTGFDVKKIFDHAKGNDAAIVGGTFGLACYINDSWPNVLYLAYRYVGEENGAEGVRKALLQNANLGGENCHRGSVLGSIVAAATGAVPKDLVDGLLDSARAK